MLKKIIMVLLIGLGFVSPAMSQTITNYNWDTPICMNRFEAPKGTVGYDDFVMNNLAVYLENNTRGDRFVAWGRYNEETKEFVNAPVVAFQLNSGFFAIELGSLEHGRTDYVDLAIRANSCNDLVLHRKDGSQQSISHITAYLRWPGDYEIPADKVHLFIHERQRYLDAIAKGHGPLVIVQFKGIGWQMQGDRIQHMEIYFEILDTHFL